MGAQWQNLPGNVSRESRDRLETYVDLLQRWQTRINLIGPATLEQIWLRHVADSLQLLPLLPPSTKAIADLGTGAGFPGLVLAIAGHVQAHLYESNSKKAAFLREAIRAAGVSAELHPVRLETLRDRPVPMVEVVTARALAPLDRLLVYAEPFLRKGATGLFHKGKDVDAELTEATKYWRINSVKHPSVTDSNSAILEVKEAIRVRNRAI